MEKRQVEILAPAGSFDSMKAAVAAGADAVYMGGSRFGARAYADNPDEKGLLEAITTGDWTVSSSRIWEPWLSCAGIFRGWSFIPAPR